MSNYRIIPRHDTKANWEKNNPILLKGEIGNVDDDPNLYKIGNGMAAWNSLPYRGYNGTVAFSTGNSENAVMSQKAVTDELTTVDGRLTELEKAQFPLTVTTTLSSSLLEYTGSAQTVTVNYNVTRKGAATIPNTLKAIVDGTATTLTPASNGSYNASVNKDGTINIAIQATKDGMTATATKTIRMIRAMYFGFASTSEANSLNKETDLSKRPIKDTPAGSYRLENTANGNYLWLCVPDNMIISKVTLNGFDVPIEAPVTINKYKYYRSSNQLVDKNYTFDIDGVTLN